MMSVAPRSQQQYQCKAGRAFVLMPFGANRWSSSINGGSKNNNKDQPLTQCMQRSRMLSTMTIQQL